MGSRLLTLRRLEHIQQRCDLARFLLALARERLKCRSPANIG